MVIRVLVRASDSAESNFGKNLPHPVVMLDEIKVKVHANLDTRG